MRLAEELIILLLNEESGYLEQVHGWNLSCVLAGAVLADLALESRIDTDLESLTLIDATPTGDELLDPVLAEIADESETRNAQFWVEKTSARSDAVLDMVLTRLVANKILHQEIGGFWSVARQVSRSGTYRAADGTVRQEVRSRIRHTIVDNEIPAPRDAIIIGLVNSCDAFRYLLPEEDYAEFRDRISVLSRMDLVSRAIAAAVAESTVQLSSRALEMTRPIPAVNLFALPFKRSFWQGNLAKLTAELYRKYGPVFMLKAPFAKRGIPIIAGPDANTWMNRKSRLHVRNKDCLADWEKVYGANRTLPGMDGAEHYRLRKAQRPSYSRAALEGRMDELYEQARAGLRTWKAGDVLPGGAACRALMGSELSRLTVGIDTSEYILDMVAYKERSLITHVQHSLPKFMLHTPGMRKKRKKVYELLGKIEAAHTPAQRKGKPRDFIDDMMSLHVSDPQFLPQTDTDFVYVTPLIASIYVGSALALAIYSMVSHPQLHERVQAEADALFRDGDPHSGDFSLAAIDVTHRLIMESHRLHPIIPVTIRHVMNDFVFAGHEITAGSRMIIGWTASHYLDENFPNSAQFDIDRYLPGREEHKKRGSYAPFGLGTHTCLGSHWVELQLAVNLLLIAHHFDIELRPADYRLRFNPFPTSKPSKKLQFAITALRHPIAAAAAAEQARESAAAASV